MKKFVFFSFVLLCMADVEAKPRRYYTYSGSQSNNKVYTYVGSDNSTAQGVAETMARLGRVGHFGGNFGFEGCGSGFTQEQAYRNCCYANSGMTTVDVGYAQGSDGRWYCCRRYR